MQAMQEQAKTAPQALIESRSGKFGCICVTRMLCEERLELLDGAAFGGWELITRGVHWFAATDQKGNVTGEEAEEYWYFRRSVEE